MFDNLVSFPFFIATLFINGRAVASFPFGIGMDMNDIFIKVIRFMYCERYPLSPFPAKLTNVSMIDVWKRFYSLRMIDTIKLFRETYNLSLKEAHDLLQYFKTIEIKHL